MTASTTSWGFPFRVGADGRTASDVERQVRDLIELVIFTEQGERINRPDFGSGARQLLFGAASPEVAAAVELLIQGALQRWLGDVMRVERLAVTAQDATLRIDIAWRLLATDEQQFVSLVREG
jgi:phage baseplate assembly protein W